MRGVQISTILTQQDHQKLSITKMKHPLLDRWVRVLSSITPPGKPIPNINTVTRANMSVTLQEKLREIDPELFQSILATPIEKIEDSIQDIRELIEKHREYDDDNVVDDEDDQWEDDEDIDEEEER